MNETTTKSKGTQKPTRRKTWLETHAPLAEVTENARAAAIDLWCPELALAHLVMVECGPMNADPGELGEGDAMAHATLDAMEGLGKLIATSAAATRRSYRMDIPDSETKRDNDRSTHLRQIRTAVAQLVDLSDLHDVLMGLAPLRGAK